MVTWTNVPSALQVHLRTGHEGSEEEYGHSSNLSLTSALDGGGWSTPCPGKETRYPRYRRPRGTHGRSVRARKSLLPPGINPRTVQPVASRYPGPVQTQYVTKRKFTALTIKVKCAVPCISSGTERTIHNVIAQNTYLIILRQNKQLLLDPWRWDR